MRLEDKVLELVKEKPLLMSELRERLQLSTEGVVTKESKEFDSVMAFLEKYELVETINLDTPDRDEMVWIMPRGLQLLNLPSLPEDETTAPSDFSEATINRIRKREEERQEKIAGTTK